MFGFCNIARIRLVFKLALNIRRPERKKNTAGPGPKLKIKLSVFFGCPGPGVSKGNLIDLPASKRPMSPSNLYGGG